MLMNVLYNAYLHLQENQGVFLCAFLLFFGFYKLVVYPFYISALKDIPGPYLHRVSHIPSLNAQRKFQWIKKVHDLHEKYGEVVILSPSAISCNGDPKYINDIYVKNMPKTKFYENFKNHGMKDNMFSEPENGKHLRYKKMLQGLYLKSAVFNAKNTTRTNIVEKVGQLVDQVYLSSVSGKRPDLVNAELKLNEHGKGHKLGSGNWFNPQVKKSGLGIDVYSLFGSLAMDVVSAFELGISNGTCLLKTPEQRLILVPHRMTAGMVFWTTLMPRFWDWAAGPTIRAASKKIEAWQLELYRVAEENVPEKRRDQNLSTLETLKKNGFYGTNAYSFLSDNIFAGHETTAIQLTYMCYELSRPLHLEKQAKLRSEIREAFGEPGSLESCIDSLEEVDKLPYLEALIQENSRVHTSIPGAEPRRTNTPYEVAVDGKSVTLPVGTGISCQPYLMHRVSKVFPNPEAWIPERWLQNSNESLEDYAQRLKEMQRYMMPFGKGIRMCLGMNLALIEMKMALANLYWRYELTLCSDWCQVTPAEESGHISMGKEFAGSNRDESMMTMEDSYTTRPHYDECWLAWRSV
ncbi:cytochrome P450 [Metschnikowia bicuspidata var. bicuspidata NRRL YB-4993]|uniref:Cytochrome P450 n=1 Tax=Metschnikowia bicuspidata var. bicuspidata NRRL YB-4993 TaxID=869754 RepID=A0A1A0H7N2_9ASCO|nr:cytochrome P450 [Metschnikowia bicuspidata var. bicuspidata NRRL YB-4993]OBA19990.1 cytochrome P450 [Metschnikowia bicuspidata var. bicuspidata NRRL YB-4993]